MPTNAPARLQSHRTFAIVLAAGFAFAAAPGTKAAVALVDFETNPTLSTAPSIYVAVPAMQPITTPQASFTGGVVLGFATFFPAISFATAPNVYGTADFANKLPEQLSIAVNPAFPTTEISFALFNGEVFAQSYTVNAFNGSSLVASQHLTSIPANFNSGYSTVDLLAPGGITNVTITPDGSPSAWDFLIDTVAFNQSILNVVPPNSPPGTLPIPPSTPPETPPDPPVLVHRHGHGEPELLEVNFGDDSNDVRGSTVVPSTVPEPASLSLLALGAITLLIPRRRRARRSPGAVSACESNERTR